MHQIEQPLYHFIVNIFKQAICTAFDGIGVGDGGGGGHTIWKYSGTEFWWRPFLEITLILWEILVRMEIFWFELYFPTAMFDETREEDQTARSST